MKKIVMGLLVLISTAAFAQVGSATGESKNADMSVPKVGGSEFSAGVNLPMGSVEYTSSKSTVSGLGLNLEYGYSFNEFATVYVTQGYLSRDVKNETSTSSTTYKTRGLGDTAVGLKAILDFAPAFFYYDVSYQRGLFNKAKANSSTEVTAVSVRPSFNFVAGGGTSMNSFGFGALVGYSLYQEGDFDADSSGSNYTDKTGNGSRWKIYAQYEPSWKLGLAYQMATVDAFDRTANASTARIDKEETQTVSVYGIIPVTPVSEVLVQLDKPETRNTHADYKAYTLAASYRMLF